MCYDALQDKAYSLGKAYYLGDWFLSLSFLYVFFLCVLAQHSFVEMRLPQTAHTE